MDNIFFLVFRRMRRPLLTLALTYAVAVLGLVLIPGQDDAGQPWRMDFFHAFYFVSFMSTTIGFGEIPYAFTDGQRLWVTFSMFASVVAWIYAIGNLLTLVQDKAFQAAVTERQFARRIRRQRDPFYLVCGYGETGGALVRELTERDQLAVVIDIDPDRINMLELANLRQYVPALCGDAGVPRHLQEAGLGHPLCQGVVALTNVNEVNLKVALTSKLLHPDIRVICRAESQDVEANMASFGTDYIIDPFEDFARHLAVALQAPGLHLLRQILTGEHGEWKEKPLYPPSDGHWIVCGYGRFGKAVNRHLLQEGLQTRVIEATPEKTGVPPDGWVLGRGTEADTLEQADVRTAVGLVAGTDDDTNNLSIILTARELNPDLFVVLRQNQKENRPIIDAVDADMVMHPSAIIANRIRVLLGTPMLYRFISLAKHQSDAWSCELVGRISALLERRASEVWELEVNEQQAPALHQALQQGEAVTVAELTSDPGAREQQLPCLLLMREHSGVAESLPDPDQLLKAGDRLLFCGRASAHDRMRWALNNEHSLKYVRTGTSAPEGWAWTQLRRWIGKGPETPEN